MIFLAHCTEIAKSPAISEISAAILEKFIMSFYVHISRVDSARIRDEVPDDRVLGTAPTLVQQQIMPRHANAGTAWYSTRVYMYTHICVLEYTHYRACHRGPGLLRYYSCTTHVHP